MKVILVSECKSCPLVRHSDYSEAMYCDHDDIGNIDYDAPTVGIRPDCPLEELGVVSDYTRSGCTQTEKKK